jgi:hypothetical protein
MKQTTKVQAYKVRRLLVVIRIEQEMAVVVAWGSYPSVGNVELIFTDMATWRWVKLWFEGTFQGLCYVRAY